MKIVARSEFLAMPAGTVFSKYTPCVFSDLCIKGETILGCDFFYQQIADAIDFDCTADFVGKLSASQETGMSLPMDFECETRDGAFDEGQRFAVWEERDVRALIARLQRCVP